MLAQHTRKLTALCKTMDKHTVCLNSSSGICVYIIIFNVFALYIENYIYKLIHSNILSILLFNLMVSLSLILICNAYKSPSYTTLHETDKADEIIKLQVEFLKLAGNLCLMIMISFISLKYGTLNSSIYSGIISSVLFVLIMLRWNSKIFLKKSALLFLNLFDFKFTEAVPFSGIIVADVCTSLSKASSLSFERYPHVKTIIFW